MPYPKVTVVGAGQVGATTAELLLLHDIADVVLVDIAEGLPQGKALDLMHSRSVLRFGPTISGTNDYAQTAGSDIVVITAGVPRKPGMTRDDLLAINSEIVRGVMSQAVTHSPDAVFLLVTNPLDIMVYLAWKESGLPSERVLGMGGVLDSARFAFAVAEKTGEPISDIEALACGAHGDAMVPMPRFTTIRGVPITETLDPSEVAALVERTTFGGAEVVALLKTGSAFYAPAASIVRMIKALLDEFGDVLPSCVLLRGEYGIDDVYMSVPASLAWGGARGVVELDLDEGERVELQTSAATIAEALDSLGLRA